MYPMKFDIVKSDLLSLFPNKKIIVLMFLCIIVVIVNMANIVDVFVNYMLMDNSAYLIQLC